MDGLSDMLSLFQESTIYVDPRGDLDLAINRNEKLRNFRVSSSAMCRASPVWGAMLTNGFKESSPGSDPVTFPEDDVLAFFILLLASHLRFPEIPRVLDLELLKEVCVLCDKYDCLVVVQPFLDRWKLEVYFKKGYEYTPEGYRSWAWIGWSTGDPAIIHRVKEYYILHSRTNAAKELLDTENSVLDEELPSGLVRK
ncbi:MAG: hypothetical protein Q9195_002814 [Heterodermia aff. obscurata]